VNSVPSSTWAAIPLGCGPGAPTWNTQAPLMGSESAEMTRHATVYVPRCSSPSIRTATDVAPGRVIRSPSTRLPVPS
jgi:hypothetical protein